MRYSIQPYPLWPATAFAVAVRVEVEYPAVAGIDEGGKVYPLAKTIILMKPNYPLTWFDYAVIPQHDGIAASERVLITRGALNPIMNKQRHQAHGLFPANQSR